MLTRWTFSSSLLYADNWTRFLHDTDFIEPKYLLHAISFLKNDFIRSARMQFSKLNDKQEKDVSILIYSKIIVFSLNESIMVKEKYIIMSQVIRSNMIKI